MRRLLLGTAVLKLTALALYVAVLRDRQLQWGATAAEAAAALPGDDVLPHADVVATRAVDVAAPATAVWPWLAQLGQGRGGFYSYDRLENLAGCRIRSAETIVSEWQAVAVGDEFRLHPEIALRVVAVDPPWSLVVAGLGEGADAAPYDFVWAFVLRPVGGSDRVRLLVRERYLCRGLPARAMVEAVSVVSFIMTERMLRGIRNRAQAGAANP